MDFSRTEAATLRGSCGVLVHENHHPTVKAPLAETFGDKRNGSLSRKFESQWQKLKFETGNVPEPGQFFLVVAMFGHRTIEAEPDRRFAWRQLAHDAKAANSTAGVPSQIDEEAIGALEGPVEGGGHFIGEVDADIARKKAHL